MCPGKTLMLVEDEAIIALGEKMTLEKAGYNVVLASSGEQAVEQITSSEIAFDLVLMDIDLGPGIDGTQAASEILKIRDLPVVFLTSHTEQEYTDRADQITSYGYVVKRSGDAVLLSSIKMAFRLFEAKKALRESNQRLAAFLQISQTVTAATNMGSLVERIVNSITEATSSQFASVYLKHGPDKVRQYAKTKSSRDKRYTIVDLRNHPHVKNAIETGDSLVVVDTSNEDWSPDEREIVERFNMRTVVFMPIRSEEGTAGVIFVGVVGKAYGFTDVEISLLRGFATEVGRLITRVRALDESRAMVERLESRLFGW